MKETEIHAEFRFVRSVGESSAWRRAPDDIEMVAPADRTVLIYGQTGAGKELIARAVHDLSRGKARAFVRLNCAAIRVCLVDSELFGNEKGAFTEAIAQRVNRSEMAHRGTTFLDEIGGISLKLQVAKDQLGRRESSE
jgi:formate hydrogenlyase transcriptional activator